MLGFTFLKVGSFPGLFPGFAFDTPQTEPRLASALTYFFN